MELRCDSKKHGVIIDESIIEVKCDSRFCGARPGQVVLHRFTFTGTLVETLKFKEPGRNGKHAAHIHSAPVRTA